MINPANGLGLIARNDDADLLTKIADALGEDKAVFVGGPPTRSRLEDTGELLAAWYQISDLTDRQSLIHHAQSLAVKASHLS